MNIAEFIRSHCCPSKTIVGSDHNLANSPQRTEIFAPWLSAFKHRIHFSHKMTTKKVYSDDRGEFETDERWVAIDNYSMSHLHPPSRPSHVSLQAATSHQTAKGLPEIELPPVIGKFLSLQCRLLGVKHVLEVGTLGGYSAIWLLLENPGLRVTTCEFNPHHATVAQENFDAAGVADRVEILVGPALDHLPRLHQEILEGKRERFGLSFIDADKQNNYNYLDWAVKMSFSGGCVFVDNVVSKGRLADAEAAKTDHMVGGGREVVERVGKDDRVDGVVLQIASEKDYDGFLFAAIK